VSYAETSKGVKEMAKKPSAEVVEMTTEQYETFLGAEISRWREAITLDQFIRAYRDGELDDGDPEVSRLAALVGLGQNGR
jgi:hypothetical protein